MSAGIYLIQADGKLVEMTEQPYETEDVLQKLLADYPSVLAGDQVNRASPRRWVLISREMAVPSEVDGFDRWALDHLFLDQDAIPTLVEVKRRGDTRIRREVVGQLLDYAANAVVYWPLEALRTAFEKNCKQQNTDPELVLATVIGEVGDQEQFWQAVETNLLAGRVRLVFLADEIPPELQRIVEFLNAQMHPAEVLAVEIRQYVGQGLRTLVPKVIGHTPPRADPPTTPARQWSEELFFAEFPKGRGADETAVARRNFDWAKDAAQHPSLIVAWPKRARFPAMYVRMEHNGITFTVGAVGSTGTFNFDLYNLRQAPPFDDPNSRIELIRRLNEIPGVNIRPDYTSGYPSFPIILLKVEAALVQFQKVVDWVVDRVRTNETVGEKDYGLKETAEPAVRDS